MAANDIMEFVSFVGIWISPAPSLIENRNQKIEHGIIPPSGFCSRNSPVPPGPAYALLLRARWTCLPAGASAPLPPVPKFHETTAHGEVTGSRFPAARHR